MGRSIRLHKEHGVNPTIAKCFVCGKEKNEIAFLGAAYKDEAPMRMVVDKVPCSDCQEKIEQGFIIMIVVKDGESGENTYRTGEILYLKVDAFKKIMNVEPPAVGVCLIDESGKNRLMALAGGNADDKKADS